jgi:polyhydroxyalkanoate synthesis regulator phasin
MFDLMQRMLYTSVGLASLTREKLAELGQELARHADLTEAQARQFQEDLVKKGDEARNQLQAEIDRRVAQTLASLKVARQDQADALLRRVEALEQQVAALQAAGHVE